MKGKGCIALGEGNPAKSSHTGRVEGGLSFSHSWFGYTLWTLPALWPQPSHPAHSDAMVRRAKVLPGPTGMGEAWGEAQGRGIPFLASQSVCSLVKATGGRGGTGRGKGTLQVFCFYKWELSNSTFSRLSSSILGTPGGFNRAHREDESHDSHSCLWCL